MTGIKIMIFKKKEKKENSIEGVLWDERSLSRVNGSEERIGPHPSALSSTTLSSGYMY